jgi:transposase
VPSDSQPTAKLPALEIAELRVRLAEVEGKLDELLTMNLALVAENERLRARAGMNSKNSSKPPSSDGYAKPPPKTRRVRSGKKPGKQPGSEGNHLAQVAEADELVIHRPDSCDSCGSDLVNAPVTGTVTRQVFDLPPRSVVVTEHRSQRRRCACGTTTTAGFPAEAIGPACYGPVLRAHVCYLVVRQHIPIKRVAELLCDAYGIPVSTGAIVAMVQEGSNRLGSFLDSLADRLRDTEIVHADETGLRVGGDLHWVHATSSRAHSLYHLDTHRGRKAMDAMDVLAHLRGVLVHDGWQPYRDYTEVDHALCNAHHLRELDGISGNHQDQGWAHHMAALLSATWTEVLAAKDHGVTSLDPAALDRIRTDYDTIIEAGRLVNPPAVRTGKRGRPRNTLSANLLRRLDIYRDDILRFADDFRVPFDNNEAERSVRMVRVQQKISGGFRSVEGARSWLRVRSYVATAIKQGMNPLDALVRLTADDPWMPDSPHWI